MKKKFIGFGSHDIRYQTKHFQTKIKIRDFVEGYSNTLGDEGGDVHDLISLNGKDWVSKLNEWLVNNNFNFTFQEENVLKVLFHPDFQRNYVVGDDEHYNWRCSLIDTISSNEPINPISIGIIVDADGNLTGTMLVVIDGQQRLITICNFVVYSDAYFYDCSYDGKIHEKKSFDGLPKEYQENILNYEFNVNICVGTEEAIHRYFEKINQETFVLNDIELLCSSFCNRFTEDAKHAFSVPTEKATKKGRFLCDDSKYCVLKYGNGKLEKKDKGLVRMQALRHALSWASICDDTNDNKPFVDTDLYSKDRIEWYMDKHKNDIDASNLRNWVETIIDFFRDICCCEHNLSATDYEYIQRLDARIGLANFYKKYHTYPFTDLQKKNISDRIWELLDNGSGGWSNPGYIFEWSVIVELYGIDEGEKYAKKLNALAPFPEKVKRKVFNQFGHRCPIDNEEYEFEELHAHHIIPRFCGGQSYEENCFLLPIEFHQQWHNNGGYINGVRYSQDDLINLRNEHISKIMKEKIK